MDDPAKIQAYNRQVADAIARLGPADFVPNLTQIDQVIASLGVKGPLLPIVDKSANFLRHPKAPDVGNLLLRKRCSA